MGNFFKPTHYPEFQAWLINSAALGRVGTSDSFARFLPGFYFAFKIVVNTWPRKKKY
jgi:hypothetical protein